MSRKLKVGDYIPLSGTDEHYVYGHVGAEHFARVVAEESDDDQFGPTRHAWARMEMAGWDSRIDRMTRLVTYDTYHKGTFPVTVAAAREEK